MRMFSSGIIAALVLGGLTLAQDTTQAPPEGTPAQEQQNPAPPRATQSLPSPADTAQANPAPRVAPGSVIPVTLTKTVDAKKAKTGDEVDARVTQDMKTGSGEVIVPKDTKVVGHVTRTQARSKEQKESQVVIAFDHVVMNGGEVPMPMSIQAIVGPQNPNPASTNNNSSAGGESAGVPAASGAPGNSGNGNARPGGMSSGAPATAPTAPTGGDETATRAPAATGSRPPITGNTQGVVGISDLKLSMADNSLPGSVVSSEKNNVKLESGMLMLLRVNP